MRALPYWRLSGYYFFHFAFNGIYMPYFGLYLLSLDFSAWDIGVLMSVSQIVRIFGPAAWGWLADQSGGRVAIVRWSGAAGLVAFAGFFMVREFPSVLIVAAVLALFWSAALPLFEALTFNHLRDAPGRYSHIRLWGSIGFILAVLGGGIVLDYLPIVSVLWLGCVLLAGMLCLALAVPDAKPSQATLAAASVRDILSQSRVLSLFFACFAMSAAHGALYVFYSIHLTEHHYSKTAVGILWSLGVLAEIAVFLGMSHLVRRFSLRLILLVSLTAAALRFLVIGWSVELPIAAVLAQLMHGLTFGAFHAAAISAIHQWFPGATQARGQALYSSVSFGAGGLLGSLLSGWAWGVWGAGWTFSLSSGFALLGLIALAVVDWRDKPSGMPLENPSR